MTYQFGHNPNRVSALELVVGSFEDLQNTFYDVLYPEFLWRDVVPEASVNTGINPGATSTSYRVRDHRGKGSFRGRHDNGVPTVGRTLDKNIIPIEVAGVSAIFDREDARQTQMGLNENLLTELPKIMREACDRHVEGTIFYGDADVGFLGWLDYPGVILQTAPNGAGGNSEWSTKTPDEIVADINDAITAVWVGSKQIHLPNTVYLPGTQLAAIASRKMSENSDKTILEYVRQNNIYSSLNGGAPLEIKSIRYLDQAGAGNTDRMAVAEVNERNVQLPFPLPYDLLEPQEHGYDVNIFAEYKFGSFHMPYPRSMVYVDGI